ncbi:EAL domain-containing protein [Streptacidiphilus sp. PB12-B1b]|uniref:putative bifunctional diguanylate cyclase/phosphodiesterase n=1 Tax=Streptacidiphilus sp. PB12-B1b TaxID=2705012 RepID=UPI0015F7D124|nr:EAL domain-containing protein [Streptacidiphilus sp. PB12-B1b]QMU77159.1 EAL domain-containing protein [Streptacidiphilus sp. PB12-B1b]
MVALTCVYYAFSSQRLIFVGIGLSGVIGILIGVAYHRPSHSLPWYLLAAANLSFTAGEFAQIVIIQYLHESLFPSVADAFYLATYGFYAAGLLGFVRWRTAWRDRASLIDALTLTVGLALVCWIFVIVPYANSPGQSWIQKATSIAYPLGDILVLAMLLRLLAPRGGKSVSLVLLTFGTLGLLSADIAYALIQLHGVWRTGTAVDLGWAVLYGAWGAAALHPSMVTLTQPMRWRPDTGGVRLGLLTLASLIAPAMLLLAAARGDTRSAGVIGAFSAVLFLLVLYRLAGVAETHRRALTRERALRGAVASLGAAGEVSAVSTAVQQAMNALVGDSPRHHAVLALRSGDRLSLTRAADGSPIAAQPQTSALVHAQAEGGRTRLLGVDALGAELTAHFRPVRSALVCPLAAREQSAPDPLIGALIVAGDERDLLVLRDSLTTLATQGALAVERIALSQEVSRRNSEAYFRTLVQNASDVILILDEENRIKYASPSARQVLGSGTLAGSRLADLIPPQESGTVSRALSQMRMRDEPDRREHWQMLRTDRATIEVEVRCSDLRREATVAGLVLTLRDVTEQRQLERELTHRAFHDSLTGLANRVLFQERVNHALTQSQREGTVVGVLFVDVDDFKVVNDTQGHPVGDELLVAISLRLSTAVRVSDTAARIGGDEFALLVEDPMTPRDLEIFADHVLDVFAEPFRLSVGPVSVNASVGIATTEDSYDSVELLTHADLALYEAKTAGKRQWRRYHPALQSGMVERHELMESLDRSLVEQFVVLYQPIVELASGTIVGFEALVRWPHSTRGTVLPEQFITLAEESGQIVPLGAWVLGRAAAEAVSWRGATADAAGRSAGLKAPYVSVNVSPRQFRDHGFLEVVQHVIDQSGIQPSSLVIELTESLLMRHDDRVLAEMQSLTDLGVRIAIDDFGTGYSSLSYLREFPISILKIDKSFIDELGHSTQQYALVDGITHLADTLGLTVIAEGVENTTQQELLVAMGCPLGQGYLFAKPVGAEEARALILAGAARAASGGVR